MEYDIVFIFFFGLFIVPFMPVLGWALGQVFILLLWAKNPLWTWLIPLLGLGSFLATDALLHFTEATWELEINLDPLLSTLGDYVLLVLI